MSIGKEYLHQLHDALAAFEEAVKQHANPGFLQSKTPLQQDVDNARKRVVDVVVQIVTQERMKRGG